MTQKSLEKWIGAKFGRLTILKLHGVKYRHKYWLCQCACGKQTIVHDTHLPSGHTKSCGCLQKEQTAKSNHKRKLKYGEASFNSILAGYKHWGKERGYSWNLTKEQFRQLTLGNCYYCGTKPSQVRKSSNCNGSYVFNGVDRVDNTKGYEPDNVVSCCKKCNIWKTVDTAEELLKHAKTIVDYNKRKNK